MGVADTMRRKLVAAFAPGEIAIEDESARHAGHAGARPEGETHFRLRIVSSAFAGMSRIERQRRIYGVLRDELRDRVHALSIEVHAPGDFGARGVAEPRR
ncbi:MAG: BolA family protein [Rhizomicrobium sp.]